MITYFTQGSINTFRLEVFVYLWILFHFPGTDGTPGSRSMVLLGQDRWYSWVKIDGTPGSRSMVLLVIGDVELAYLTS